MYRNEIEGFIDSHREEMIEDICTLCRINSEKMSYVEGKPYGEDPSQALQTALGMAENYSFSIRNYGNYVGTVDLNDKERQLDILAHLDVVPAGEGWMEIKSFEPMVKDERPFGRGTTGDKGLAVVTLRIMRVTKEPGISLSESVRLILGTDEECRSSDIVDYHDKEDEAPMTFFPDVEFPVINIEKGHLGDHPHASSQASKAMPRLAKVEAGIKANVVSGKARAIVEGIDLKTLEAAAEAVEKETGISFALEGDLPAMTVTAQGEGIYAPIPQEGKNALIDLLVYLTCLSSAEYPQTDVVRNLLRLFPHGDTYGKAAGINMGDGLSSALALAFSMLTIGADGLEGVLGSRYLICAAEESVLGAVKQAMANQELILENNSMIPSHHVDGNSYFVRTLLSVYEDYTGLEGDYQAIGGGTYIHSLRSDVAHSAALPGTNNRMHEANEFAAADELVLSAKIFAQVVVGLCS